MNYKIGKCINIKYSFFFSNWPMKRANQRWLWLHTLVSRATLDVLFDITLTSRWRHNLIRMMTKVLSNNSFKSKIPLPNKKKHVNKSKFPCRDKKSRFIYTFYKLLADYHEYYKERTWCLFWSNMRKTFQFSVSVEKTSETFTFK